MKQLSSKKEVFLRDVSSIRLAKKYARRIKKEKRPKTAKKYSAYMRGLVLAAYVFDLYEHNYKLFRRGMLRGRKSFFCHLVELIEQSFKDGFLFEDEALLAKRSISFLFVRKQRHNIVFYIL